MIGTLTLIKQSLADINSEWLDPLPDKWIGIRLQQIGNKRKTCYFFKATTGVHGTGVMNTPRLDEWFYHSTTISMIFW